MIAPLSSRLAPMNRRQNGAALVTALMFLIILTLLGFAALQESRVSLRLASNETARMTVMESSQSLVDLLLADIELHFPVMAQADVQVGCFRDASDTLVVPFPCDEDQAWIEAPPEGRLSDRSYLEIWRDSINGEALLPAASVGTTGTTARVRYARFRVTAGVDRTDSAEGSAEIIQGVQIPVPTLDGVALF